MESQKERIRRSWTKRNEIKKLISVFDSASHEIRLAAHRKDILNAVKVIDNSTPTKASSNMYSQTSYKNQRNDLNQRLRQNLVLVNSINNYARSTGKVESFNPTANLRNSNISNQLSDLKYIDLENKRISKALKTVRPKDISSTQKLNENWELLIRPTCIKALKYSIAINTLLLPEIDPNLENPPTPEIYKNSKKVFFVFRSEDGENLGRIHIMLDCEADSDLIQKFIDLCRCKYKNCKVYKILPGLFVETGDISNNDGSGKDSENSMKLNRKTWNCENYLQPRSVSMILEDDKSVGSKFEISLKKTAKFRNQVVIGRVVKGFEVVVALERFGSRFGRPIKAVFIENCGIMK